jgi:hypothetical protein
MTRFALPSERSMLPGATARTAADTPIIDLMRCASVAPAASAAAPHVAGTVGLILSSAPQGGLFDSRWNLDDVLGLLKLEAAPETNPDPHATGWGRVRLPIARPSVGGAQLVVTGYGAGGVVRLRLTGAPPGARNLQIFDVTGRLRGTLAPATFGPGVLEYAPPSMPARLKGRGRYWAYDPVSRASASFYWSGGKK